MVEEDPFIPIAWQKDHSGMQGIEYFTHKDSIEQLTATWLEASTYAIEMAKELNNDIWIPKDTNNWLKKDGTYKQIIGQVTTYLIQNT